MKLNPSAAHAGLAAALFVVCSGQVKADTSAITEYSFGDNKQTIKTYRKETKNRTEPDANHAMIATPESTVLLDLTNKTFIRIPTSSSSGSTVANPVPVAAVTQKKKGIVTTRVEMQDTGERKQIFGYEARRLKINTTTKADQDACEPGEWKIETDGWYADIPSDGGAPANNDSTSRAVVEGCIDDQRVESVGSGKSGYPVEYVSKTWINGQGPQVMSMKVLEYSNRLLDPSLFTIPDGFSDRSGEIARGTKSAGRILIAVAPAVNADTSAAARLTALLNAESAASVAVPEASLEAAKRVGAEYMLTNEQQAEAPKKSNGMFGKLARSMGGSQVQLKYKLTSVKTGETMLESSVSGSQGGNGLLAAMSVASIAAPVAGAASHSYIAQTAIQSAMQGFQHTARNSAYSGVVDPQLQSLAYMSYYSPMSAGATAAGMAVGAATTKSSAQPGSEVPAAGALENALRQEAKAVADKVLHQASNR